MEVFDVGKQWSLFYTNPQTYIFYMYLQHGILLLINKNRWWVQMSWQRKLCKLKYPSCTKEP